VVRREQRVDVDQVARFRELPCARIHAHDAEQYRCGVAAAGLIVVAGEALIDLVPADDGRLVPHPGGGPFNTARSLGRLGRPVAYLGRVSTDRFGARLAGLLAEDGVRLDAHVRTDEPTTLALVELDGHGAAAYRFYTAATAAAGLTPEAALGALPADAAYLHVGTLGLVLEPMADALEALVAERAGRALVMADPNCRPTIISDPPRYRARLARILRGCDVAKVSDDDLAWLAPGVPPAEAARALLAQGPSVVLLTRGAEGAVALTTTGETPVKAPPIELVDTIGAGDAFSGGWLSWWSERDLGRDDLGDHDAVAEATRFACRVAAITCSRAGAEPPRREEL